MASAYSTDLRIRVIDTVQAGASRREAAERRQFHRLVVGDRSELQLRHGGLLRRDRVQAQDRV